MLPVYYAFQSVSIGIGAVAARVFDRSHVSFPYDLFEMPGGMAGFINAEIAS
jgi:hypothetical protein